MNGLDLFSGCGGIALAVAPWVRTVAYCERDNYACGVLMSRMANGDLRRAPIWDDVTTLSRAELGDYGANYGIDFISAGFPCQDISLAGSGRGLAGERSGLFGEVARLAGELRPRFIFLENVPAIRTRGADVVCATLAQMRYDARWFTLSASDVGAPHKRERWWLLARRRDWFQASFTDANGQSLRIKSEREQLAQGERGNVVPAIESGAREPMANANGGGLARDGARDDNHRRESSRRHDDGQAAFAHWRWESAPKPEIRGMDDGLQERLERLRLLGNSVVPYAARVAFTTLCGL